MATTPAGSRRPSAATPRRGEIDAAAAEVFNTLAQGGDAIGLEDFQRCATVLAQLSEDFVTDSKIKFEHMDRNKDALVQRSEFIDEVHSICEVIGVRKAMAALEQVLGVARRLAGQQAQQGGSSASRPASGGAARGPPPARPGAPAAAGALAGNQGLGLDIRPKPLHPRGGKERRGAREKVVANMIEYFRGLRQQYEDRLAEMLRERRALDLAEEEDVAPPAPVIFGGLAMKGEAVGRWSPGVGGGAGEEEDEEEEDAEGGDGPGAEGAARAAAAGEDEDEGEEEDEEEDEQGEGEEEEEEEEEGEGEEDDEEGEPAEEESSEGETEEEESEEDDGDSEGEAEKDDEEAQATEGRGQDLKGVGAHAEGAAAAAAADASTSAGAAAPAAGAKVAEAAAEALATPVAKAAAVPADAASAAAASAAAAASPGAAGAKAAAATGPQKKRGGKGEKKAKGKREEGQKKEGKKAAGKEAREGRQRDEAGRREPNPPRDAARPVAELAGPGRPGDGARVRRESSKGAPGQAAVRPSPGKAPAARSRGEEALDAEGVSCTQTLELGFAIRSALCNGRDVWCADWKGVVTVRERDDATKVKAEIPTNRFVWCMGQMDPGLIWMGQEAQGISLFDAREKEYKATLTGGHTGGVTCLALEGALDGDADVFPVRRGWSGSNDFTIRQWWIETWRDDGPVPQRVSSASGATIVGLKGLKVGIVRGTQMHGHTNGVRALLKIGPLLWSGSDDGSIRMWWCADSTCAEVLEDAHRGSVLKLAIVKNSVWSAGSDGTIKEWQVCLDGGSKCLRQVAPAGFEKGVYAIVPLGNDLWSCGHHPNIQVFSQGQMQKTGEHPAHEPYISNLLPVDRVETQIVWSTSLGDSKLKVWRHTIRGAAGSVDELKAANRLFEEAERTRDGRMGRLAETVEQLQAQLQVAGDEYVDQLDSLAQQLAEERAARSEAEAARGHLEAELAGLRALFEEAGLGHLLQDPGALRDFLALQRLFEEAGLAHLLRDLGALKDFLHVGRIFEEAGLRALLGDPGGLRAFLQRARGLEEVLRSLGLEDVLGDPRKLRGMLETLEKLRQVLEGHGMGACFQDPSSLAEVLSRYSGMKAAFEDHGFPELFEDPTTLAGFLRNYGRVRVEFRNVDLEYLLDSAPAMRDYLKANKEGAAELKEMRDLAERLKLMESALDKANSDLAASRKELEKAQAELKSYRDLCPDVKTLAEWKDMVSQFKGLMKLKKASDKEAAEAKRLLEEKEKERQEALERERMMALKYKELDIFKLDVIARELKKLDTELGGLSKPLKNLQTDAHKLRNHDEQQQIAPHGDKMLEQCRDLRGHIHDVINKCLSETQKMHIGVAVQDHLAAGELKEGGVMAGYVVEEVDVPDHGNSKAAKLRQGDEMGRERASRAAASLAAST